MDIENMLAFVTVAELKSISAAAASLNHVQSNMTAKIKRKRNITGSSCLSAAQEVWN